MDLYEEKTGMRCFEAYLGVFGYWIGVLGWFHCVLFVFYFLCRLCLLGGLFDDFWRARNYLISNLNYLTKW